MSEPKKYELIEFMGQQALMNTNEFWDVLRGAVVPKEMSDDQVMVFLAVAKSLDLNPINGEIYPMLTKGRVLPLVGVDGWLKRANEHPQFDGMHIKMSEDFTECTVTIWRKDRAHPTVVTEYLSEVRKDTGPWRSHPRRMLRHRTIVQGIRIAFGANGAVDEDDKHYFKAEAEVVLNPAMEISNQTADLADTLKREVKENEPTFRTIKGRTCEQEDCRKRLVQQCGECGLYYCADHWDHELDVCANCSATPQDDPDPEKEPVEVDLTDEEETDPGDSLPWDE